MFDNSRFFDIRSLDAYCSSDHGRHDSFSSIVQLQDREYVMELIKSLMSECCQELSHDNDIRRHGRSYYSTLYCGMLGPETFLRLKWADAQQTQDDRKVLLSRAKSAVESALLECQTSSRLVVTLLEGKWVGAKCMLAAAEYRLGHHEVARQHSQELLQILGEKCFRLPPEECEVLYGRAGAMQAILFLRKECQDQSLGTDLMVRLAKEILLQGRHEARVINHSMSLLWQWHGKHYLGAAHGVVGILHTLLQLTHDDWTLIEHQLAAENDPMLHPLQTMQRTLKTLTDNFCMPSGNLQSSMSSEKDRLVHWCHGATGLCLLLIRAAKVFPNGVSKNYMQLAADIAEAVLWPRGLLRKGVGLCHGISGNAYVFLQLAEALKEGDQTSSTKWKERALLYACFAVDHLNELRDTPDRPLSLYQGLGGLVCFLVDCCIFTLQPSMFPLYDYF